MHYRMEGSGKGDMWNYEPFLIFCVSRYGLVSGSITTHQRGFQKGLGAS